MDSGETIQGLNESWEFFGAKVTEWMSGVMLGFIWLGLSPNNFGASMPMFFGFSVFIPYVLSTQRKLFPDEERGIRNNLCAFFGFNPPGIPAPASLQSVWSGCPLKEYDKEKEYVDLGIDEMLKVQDDPEQERVNIFS